VAEHFPVRGDHVERRLSGARRTADGHHEIVSMRRPCLLDRERRTLPVPDGRQGGLIGVSDWGALVIVGHERLVESDKVNRWRVIADGDL